MESESPDKRTVKMPVISFNEARSPLNNLLGRSLFKNSCETNSSKFDLETLLKSCLMTMGSNDDLTAGNRKNLCHCGNDDLENPCNKNNNDGYNFAKQSNSTVDLNYQYTDQKKDAKVQKNTFLESHTDGIKLGKRTFDQVHDNFDAVVDSNRLMINSDKDCEKNVIVEKKEGVLDKNSKFATNNVVTIKTPCKQICDFKILASNVNILSNSLLNKLACACKSACNNQCYVIDMTQSTPIGYFIMKLSTIILYDLKSRLMEQNLMAYKATNLQPSGNTSEEMHLLSVNDPYIIVGNSSTILLVKIVSNNNKADPIVVMEIPQGYRADMFKSESFVSTFPENTMHTKRSKLNEPVKEREDRNNIKITRVCSISNDNNELKDTSYVSSHSDNTADDLDLRPIDELLSVFCTNTFEI